MNCKHCDADWLGEALANYENSEKEGRIRKRHAGEGKGERGEEEKGGGGGGGGGGGDDSAPADDDDDVLGRNGVEDDLVVIDCRPASEYGSSHITGAVNLSLPTLIQRRLLKGNLAMPLALGYCSAVDRNNAKVTDEQWRSKLIVLYDDSTTTSQIRLSTDRDVNGDDRSAASSSSSTSSKIIEILIEQLQKEGYRACLLQGGLKKFKATYPHLCVGCNGDVDDTLQPGLRNLRITPAADDRCDEFSHPPPDSSTSTFPVEVLPHLFLGDAKNASDLECLKRNGIKYILNVTPNVPNKFEQGGHFKYLQIPIKDHWSQNLTKYFPQSINFIDEGRRQNSGVLVHCLAGISRSVTVTVAYLMYSLSLSLNDAYDYVKRRKPNVAPNLTFMGQLLDFENALKRRHDCCSCRCHDDDPEGGSRAPPIGDAIGSCRNQSRCSSCQCHLTVPVSESSSTMT